ncbi:MAG: hypothetical protein SOY76_02465 [Veillonella caviae]|nr:hypothetical protein [Veillonella caviae]
MLPLDEALAELGFEIKKAFQRDPTLLGEYEEWLLSEKGGENYDKQYSVS